MERKKGLGEEIVERGVRLAVEAAEKVLGDPRGQEAIAVASSLAQRAVQKLEELHTAATRGAGAPDRDDYRDLEARVRRIQEQARDLGDRLEALARKERAKSDRGAPPSAPWTDPEDPDQR